VEFTDRQKDIIEQALRIVSEHGIDGLTYRNLAHAVGITEPAFYRHFAGKADILMGILEYFDALRRRLFQEIRSEEPRSLKAVEQIFARHLGLFQENPALATVLFPEEVRQGYEGLAARVLEMMKFGQQQITEIITEGIERGEIRGDLDPEQVALIVSGSLRIAVHRWRLRGRTGDLQGEGARLAGTLIAMIRPTDPASARATDGAGRPTQEG